MKKSQDDSRIKLRSAPGETEAFRQEERKRGRRLSTAAVLGIVLFFLFWISLLFVVNYKDWVFSAAWIFESVTRRLEQLYLFFFGGGSPIGITVYQYLAVILIGGGLAACGAVLQSGFKNVLAGPTTMGTMSGGSLGGMIYIVFFTTPVAATVYTTAGTFSERGFFDIYGQQLFVFTGCIATVTLVLTLAFIAGRGRLSSSAMILSGTVFSQMANSVSILIQYYLIKSNPADTRIEAVRDMMMGSINRITSWRHVLLLGIPILICVTVLLILRGKLNLMSLDEDEALTMGVNVKKYRYLVVAVSTVISAVTLSLCGHIGFIGSVAALIARKLVGPDMRVLLPNSILIGAIFFTLVFDIAYFCNLTDYLNLFTSIVGVTVMIAVILNKQGGGANEAIKRRNSAGVE